METGNAHFFEDIEFDGGNKVRNTDFEEYNDSLNAEDNLIRLCVQENVSRPSTSFSEIAYPQEEVLLKESTIQRGTKISNNLSSYLPEDEADLEIKENDRINLRQALQSFYAHK